MNGELKSLEALISGFDQANAKEALETFSSVILTDTDFLQKVKKFDDTIQSNSAYRGISEYIFDIMMMHHLSNFIADENYLDSKEWLDIEDKTIERGTELLNVMLYLSEARENNVDISMEDFLYEFLLVDEDEFQDEHRIYEDLIANQDLVEEGIDSILKIGAEVLEESEIKELFIPLILFFQEPNEVLVPKEYHHKLKPIERAILGCLLAYNNS